uniref:Uncharacterized protein n=1 Tax=Romanomermis culicivorax TaxID=13658 RepID=A0A915ICA9_ROMCU
PSTSIPRINLGADRQRVGLWPNQRTSHDTLLEDSLASRAPSALMTLAAAGITPTASPVPDSSAASVEQQQQEQSSFRQTMAPQHTSPRIALGGNIRWCDAAQATYMDVAVIKCLFIRHWYVFFRRRNIRV